MRPDGGRETAWGAPRDDGGATSPLEDGGSDPVRDHVVVDFLNRLLLDRAGGGERPLSEYLGRYPRHEEAIAAAWLKARGDGAQTRGFGAATPAAGDETRVGSFTILRELGKGGQGRVYLARDERIGRLVALKVVPRSPIAEDLAPRLRREARAASKLVHPGICAVYDVGLEETVAWIAMRYVEGESLADRLARSASPAPVAETLELVEKAARAVHFAHEAGVIHRDIKPANLMITPDGDPVVIDFGIAGHEQDGTVLTLTGEMVGTLAYMAPEALRSFEKSGDRERKDRRAPSGDVWSLGVMLYEALTLRRPFDAPTREELLYQILHEEPTEAGRLNRSIDRDLRVVLSTALAKDPSRRYRTALDFAEDLRRVQEREPIRARPIGLGERLMRFCRRNPALAASLGALLLVLAAGFAVSFTLLSRTRRTLAEREQLLADVTQLADEKLTRDLLVEEAALWPAFPENERGLVDWLARADAVLARRDSHSGARAAAKARLLAATGTEFGPQDAWLEEQLEQLLVDLERLAEARAGVAKRLEFARQVDRLTIEGPAEAWRDAAARVAADPRFAGLALTPQRGLIPVGPDPDSGLEEFAVIQTGAVPRRDGAGHITLEADSAAVLVLIPGGIVRVGCDLPSTPAAAGAPHVDLECGPYDGPVQTLDLDHYFIGKFELTQGQWLRHTGVNPATYGEGSRFVQAGEGNLHPAETMTWIEADRVMSQLGLMLPTEAQWEHAARAGTTTPFWTGETFTSLQDAANVADKTALEHADAPNWNYVAELEDGFVVHTRVGHFRPNAFGLHDVIGNVCEWCRDTWEDWREVPPRPGDGLSEGEQAARVHRGGSYSDGARDSRIAARVGSPIHIPQYSVGIRACRRVIDG